jgi:hypothetical protein
MAKGKPSAAKAVQPSATLDIDGEKYQLVYDYNAIAEAEVETGNGVNLLHGISALFLNTMSALQLRALFYAALKPLQPYQPATGKAPASGVSLAMAGRMIRIDTVPAIMAALSEAWSLSMPEVKTTPPAVAGSPTGD